jgi:TP901 family phage tail tape measure protein
MSYSARVAEAYVEFTGRDAGFQNALSRAQTALNNFARDANNTINRMHFGGAISRIRDVAHEFVALAVEVRATTRAVNALATAMAGLPSMHGFNPASMVRAYGSAQAQMVRAQAAAQAQAQRAQAAADAAAVRARGSVQAQMARAQAVVPVAIIQSLSQGAILPMLAMTGPLGMAIAGITAGLSSAAGMFGNLLHTALSVPINIVRGAVGMIGSAVSTVWNMLTSLPAMISGVLGGLTLEEIIDKAVKWETRMVRLQRITGLNAQGTQQLGRQLTERAAVMPAMPLENVAKIAEMAAKLGIANENLNLFVSDMAKFGAVLDENDIPIEEATTMIARLLAVFHRGPDEAIRFASALIKLDNVSTATGREILDVSQRLSGQAAFLGMTPQKTLALAAALREAAVPIETAGTAISQMFVRMASAEDMGQFAILAKKTTKQFRDVLVHDPLEAIKLIANSLKNMGKIEAEQFLDRLHLDGQRVRGTLLQLSAVMGKLDMFVAASEKDWNNLSSVEEGYNKVAKTTQALLDKIKNNLQLMAIAIGNALLPALKKMTDGLVIFMGDVTKFFEDNKERIIVWAETFGNAFSYVAVLFRNFPDVVALATEFGKEKLEQFWEFFKRMAVLGWEGFKWAARSAVVVVKNLMFNLILYMADIGQQWTDQIFAQMHNLTHPFGPKMKVEPIAPKFDPLVGLFGGLPDFLGEKPAQNALNNVLAALGMLPPQLAAIAAQVPIFQHMPNRQQQMRPIIDKLADARQKAIDQQEDKIKKLQADDIKARKAAEDARKPPPPPPRKVLMRNRQGRPRWVVPKPKGDRAQWDAQKALEAQKQAKEQANALLEAQQQAKEAARIDREREAKKKRAADALLGVPDVMGPPLPVEKIQMIPPANVIGIGADAGAQGKKQDKTNELLDKILIAVKQPKPGLLA